MSTILPHKTRLWQKQKQTSSLFFGEFSPWIFPYICRLISWTQNWLFHFMTPSQLPLSGWLLVGNEGPSTFTLVYLGFSNLHSLLRRVGPAVNFWRGGRKLQLQEQGAARSILFKISWGLTPRIPKDGGRGKLPKVDLLVHGVTVWLYGCQPKNNGKTPKSSICS